MRKSTVFLLFTSLNLVLLGVVGLHARHSQAAARPERLVRERMVKEYQLTDLCLFTEARYTRNPAMADLFAPFQDHPVALEHFPSGSLVTPPSPSARYHE